MAQPAAVGYLRAWDPVRNEVAWDVEMPGVYNGGIVSTAGNLVFQGTSEGEFAAYTADSGEKLWSQQLNVGIVAPAITYSVDDTQYVAVLAGFGGAVNFGVDVAITAAYSFVNVGRLFVFELGGNATAPPVRERELAIPEQPPLAASTAEIDLGHDIYHDYCAICHGVLALSPGVIADLRLMGQEGHAAWSDIVLGGDMESVGMASFADTLSEEEVAAVQSYVVSRAIADRELQATDDAPGS
ncbi:MAG: c-type cytochrome, partial [Pirellulales bacterium]|nr:c-type cytochrome [Pirellulales bacterium]